MAEGYIKLSKSGLSSSISRIRTAKEDYDQAIKVFEQTITGLDGVWNSKAQRSMLEKYESMRKSFQQFAEEIETYAAEMTAYRDGMEDLDNQLAGKIGSV